MGFELFEEDIGGNLEKAVRYEEDDEGGVVFCAVRVVGILKLELFGKVEDFGIGNIDTV